MNLLLDIGNSRVKWALTSDDHPRRLLHTGSADSESTDWLDAIGRLDATPRAAYAASVAGAANVRRIRAAVQSAWSLPLELVETRAVAGGVRSGYRDVRQWGVDRSLAVIAAFHDTAGAACVVDAGTALTLDFVDGRGQHLGGVIAPGLATMHRSLMDGTGDIADLVELAPGDESTATDFFSTTTADAIRCGPQLALAGLIDRGFRALLARESDARLYLTGGDAATLQQDLAAPAEHRPSLVLEGLAIVVTET